MFLRDELHELSSKIDINDFNVKNYKKKSFRHSFISHRQKTEPTTYRTKQDIFMLKNSAPNNIETSSKESIHNEGSNGNSLNLKTNCYTSENSRMNRQFKHNATAEESEKIKKRSRAKTNSRQRQIIKESIPQNISHLYSQKPKLENENRFKELAKANNKFELQDKHILNWLNQVLIEYCKEYKFENVEYAALKRLTIDKNSLVSQGLNPLNLNRLYKSLFVYSLGFNNLLKELTDNKITIKKNVWRVYAILLEYCSEGSFETMIGDIQRDKQTKVKQLIAQIQARQKIIQEFDETIESKMDKINKVNKQLVERNLTLEEDKNILIKDLKEIEQAYSQEVGLRLTYECKINEIHSIHLELQQKHKNLYKDYLEKCQSFKGLQEKCSEERRTLNHQKIFMRETQTQMQQLKRKDQYRSQYEDALKISIVKEREKMIADNKIIENQYLELKEKQKKVFKLEKDIKNAELIMNMMKNTENYKLDEYKKIIIENAELRLKNQQQTQKINEFLSEQNQQHYKISKKEGQISYYKKRLIQKNTQCENFKQEIQKLTENNDENYVEALAKELAINGHGEILNQYRNSIAEMKLAYSNNENQLTFYKKIYEHYEQFRKESSDQIVKLQKQIVDISRDISSKDNNIQRLQIELREIKQQNKLKNQIIRKNQIKMKDQNNILQEKLNQSQIMVSIKQTEIQNFSKKFHSASDRLKDALFQKLSIDNLYHQNLQLHEGEQNYIKKMMIEISQKQEFILTLTKQSQLWRRKYEQKCEQFDKQNNHFQSVIKTLKQTLNSKRDYIHPMLYEDLLMKYLHKAEALQHHCLKSQESQIFMQKKIEELKHQLTTNIQELSTKQQSFHKKVDQLENQKQYYKIKNINLVKEVEEKDMKIESQIKEITFLKEIREDSHKYSDMIKEKNQKISQLLKEVQRMEDFYQQKHHETETTYKKVLLKKTTMIEDLQKDFHLVKKQTVELKSKLYEKQMEENKKQTQKSEESQEILLSVRRKSMSPRKINESRRDELGIKLMNAMVYYKS